MSVIGRVDDFGLEPLRSLIETAAKANRLEPCAYLAEVFARLQGATTEAEIDALLPWKWRNTVMR